MARWAPRSWTPASPPAACPPTPRSPISPTIRLHHYLAMGGMASTRLLRWWRMKWTQTPKAGEAWENTRSTLMKFWQWRIEWKWSFPGTWTAPDWRDIYLLRTSNRFSAWPCSSLTAWPSGRRPIWRRRHVSFRKKKSVSRSIRPVFHKTEK